MPFLPFFDPPAVVPAAAHVARPSGAVGRYATFGGKKLLDPMQQRKNADRFGTPNDFWGKATSYRCPLGPDPGVGWVLMLRRDLDDLDLNAYHALVWNHEGGSTTVASKLMIVRASSMLLALAGTGEVTYLVELQDKRRVLVSRSGGSGPGYNVRIPAPPATDEGDATLFYTESINGSELWTWQTMLDNIWAKGPASASGGDAAPTLPYSPNGDPENFRFIGITGWDAIHVVLDTIGCTTAYDPLTDTITYVRLGVTQDGLAGAKTEAAGNLIYDYDPIGVSNLAEMPALVNVYFTRRYLHGVEKDTPRTSNWEMENPKVYSESTAAIGGTGGVGAMVVYAADIFAHYDADGTHTNSAEITQRGREIRRNIVNAILTANRRERKMYSGILTSMLPGGELKETIWRDYGDGQGLVTEIINSPDDVTRNNFQSGITGGGHRYTRVSASAPAQGIASESLLPIDLARKTHPLWPRLSQVVQVFEASESEGEMLATPQDGDGLFKGRVVRFTDDLAGGGVTTDTLDDCWIRFIGRENVQADKSQYAIDGQYWIGRLSGLARCTDFGDPEERPLYLVERNENWYFSIEAGTATLGSSSGETAVGLGFALKFGSLIDLGGDGIGLQNVSGKKLIVEVKYRVLLAWSADSVVSFPEFTLNIRRYDGAGVSQGTIEGGFDGFRWEPWHAHTGPDTDALTKTGGSIYTPASASGIKLELPADHEVRIYILYDQDASEFYLPDNGTFLTLDVTA